MDVRQAADALLTLADSATPIATTTPPQIATQFLPLDQNQIPPTTQNHNLSLVPTPGISVARPVGVYCSNAHSHLFSTTVFQPYAVATSTAPLSSVTVPPVTETGPPSPDAQTLSALGRQSSFSSLPSSDSELGPPLLSPPPARLPSRTSAASRCRDTSRVSVVSAASIQPEPWFADIMNRLADDAAARERLATERELRLQHEATEREKQLIRDARRQQDEAVDAARAIFRAEKQVAVLEQQLQHMRLQYELERARASPSAFVFSSDLPIVPETYPLTDSRVPRPAFPINNVSDYGFAVPTATSVPVAHTIGPVVPTDLTYSYAASVPVVCMSSVTTVPIVSSVVSPAPLAFQPIVGHAVSVPGLAVSTGIVSGPVEPPTTEVPYTTVVTPVTPAPIAATPVTSTTLPTNGVEVLGLPSPTVAPPGSRVPVSVSQSSSVAARPAAPTVVVPSPIATTTSSCALGTPVASGTVAPVVASVSATVPTSDVREPAGPIAITEGEVSVNPKQWRLYMGG